MKDTCKKTMNTNSIPMQIHGIEISLIFAEREDEYIKERIIDILSDAYEQKRLGNTAEKPV